MPSVNKKKETTVIEKIKTQTSKGEVTVNLNLRVTVDGGVLIVSEGAKKEKEVLENKKEDKYFVPEEEFDLEIPVISGFGKTV